MSDMGRPTTPLWAAQGWAFLVARGREHGYRSVLVPGPLADNGEHGVLTESVQSAGEGEATVVEEIDAPVTGTLTLVHRTHRVTAADVEPGAAAAADAADPSALVTDEHGRPLDLIYGFVVQGRSAVQPDEADLGAARDAALDAYRAFLADEAGFTARTSPAFRLRSDVRPVGWPRRSRPEEPRPVGDPRPRPLPLPRPAPAGTRLLTVAIGVIVVVLVLALGRMWLASPSADEHDPPGKATTTTSTSTTTTTTTVTVPPEEAPGRGDNRSVFGLP